MRCKSCGSENLANFTAEIAIHLPGLQNLDEPPVFVFPKLVVCLNCGTTEFVIPEGDLRLLGRKRAIGAE